MKRTIARRRILGPTFTTALLTLAEVALTLVLAPRAEAYLYWADGDIKRANLDGNGIQSLVSDGLPTTGWRSMTNTSTGAPRWTPTQMRSRAPT